jgi:hypothetical protein
VGFIVCFGFLFDCLFSRIVIEGTGHHLKGTRGMTSGTSGRKRHQSSNQEVKEGATSRTVPGLLSAMIQIRPIQYHKI